MIKKIQKTSLYSISLLAVAFFAGCAHQTKTSGLEEKAIDTAVEQTQEAHGIQSWWKKEIVEADVKVNFGGQTMVDGKFYFQAHGPKARYDRKDGSVVIFDGKTAWVSPGTAKAGYARFHVLTWPWFIMTPFKIKGEGITLSEYQDVSIGGKEYQSIFQTFDSSMGDAPDDWYRIFINSKTKLIDSMSYIVTYGKDVEEANKKPSIILYHDYKDFSGTLLSTRYEFWYWDAENNQFVGDKPKGSAVLSNIWYVEANDALFKVPEDAVEIALP